MFKYLKYLIGKKVYIKNITITMGGGKFYNKKYWLIIFIVF